MYDLREPGPAPTRLRPRGWRALLVGVLVVVLPVVEILLLVWVGRQIGLLWVLLLVFAGIVVGSWLIRRRWRNAWNSLVEASRQPPGGATDRTEREASRSVADTAVFVLGGVALMFPGLITDLVGLICLIPFTRKLPRSLLQRWVDRRVQEMAQMTGIGGFTARRPSGYGGGDVIDGEVVEDGQTTSTAGDTSTQRSEQQGAPLIISAEADDDRSR